MTMLADHLDEALVVVAERSEAAAVARRLDDDVVGLLARAGINRSFLPAELGGDERDPRDVIDALMRIGAVDGSTAWCTSISAGSNVFAGLVPEAVARRTYTDPDAGGAGMFAPVGIATVDADGRTTLTGRWPFTSNCLHSRWTGLGAFVERADGSRDPVPRLVIVPAEDLVVEDTWYGAGLQATGSHHVRADQLEVDLERSCAFVDAPWPAGSMWKVALFALLGPVLVAAPLGVARGALDHILGRVAGGEGGAMRGALRDDPVGLAELAEADTALRAARARLLEVVGQAWDLAQAGERTPRVLQAQVMLAVSHAIDVAVASTSTAHRLSGGAAASESHPVLRALRDVETARQHLLFSHQHRPVVVRIAAGSDEIAPPFVT